MHELSLAGEVIRLAEEEAEKQAALSVTEITIEVGNFSGVEADAFREALVILAQGTILGNSSINILKTTGKGYCNLCKLEFEMVNRFDACPECNSLPSHISGGKDFRVVSMMIENDDQET